jgi:hypothetical protein
MSCYPPLGGKPPQERERERENSPPNDERKFGMLIASPTEQDADMFFSHYLLYYLSVDVEQLPGNSLPVATMDGAVQGVSVQTSPSCKNSIR